MAQQCASSVSGGNNAGTVTSSTGDALPSGQSGETDYYSPGGNLSLSLCYPGSLMSVTVTDPDGAVYSKQGAPPIALRVADGPPGLYKAVVRAISVPSTGEAYSVAFATDAPCSAGNVDTGVAVRETLSNSQIASALAESGSTGISLNVQGASPTSARLVYYSDVGGMPISWTIDFYAATPGLGAVITQVTVRGVNVTTQVISQLSALGGHSIAAIPTDFVVDRVYSCVTPTGDHMMVVEGHR
jgi:hypothetical protein